MRDNHVLPLSNGNADLQQLEPAGTVSLKNFASERQTYTFKNFYRNKPRTELWKTGNPHQKISLESQSIDSGKWYPCHGIKLLCKANFGLLGNRHRSSPCTDEWHIDPERRKSGWCLQRGCVAGRKMGHHIISGFKRREKGLTIQGQDSLSLPRSRWVKNQKFIQYKADFPQICLHFQYFGL